MSDRAPIHLARPDAAELRRVLGICLAGMDPPAVLTFRSGEFLPWVQHFFLPVLAPHTVQARELSLRGEGGLLVRADAALSLPETSAAAGREILSRRVGARHLPVLRKFTAAVESGAAPGHFATVLALQAADFNVAVLPLLQSLLYCEWAGGQPAGKPRGLAAFLSAATPALALLPPLLQPHAEDAPVRLTAVR